MSKVKPIELTLGHRTKEEIQSRKEMQEKLKGNSNNIKPTQKLNSIQNEIFKVIKSEMEQAEILSNLDSYLLTQCSIAIDKLIYLDNLLEIKHTLIFNKDFKSSKKLYFDIFIKCCNDLGMTPSSRAKFANLKLINKENKEDPLLQALKEND